MFVIMLEYGVYIIQEIFTSDWIQLYFDFKWITRLHMNYSRINIHVINQKIKKKKTMYLRSKNDIFANNYFS